MKKVVFSIAGVLAILFAVFACDNSGGNSGKSGKYDDDTLSLGSGVDTDNGDEIKTFFILVEEGGELEVPDSNTVKAAGKKIRLMIPLFNPKGLNLSAWIEGENSGNTSVRTIGNPVKSEDSSDAPYAIDAGNKDRIIIIINEAGFFATSLLLKIGTKDGVAGGAVRTLMEFRLPKIVEVPPANGEEPPVDTEEPPVDTVEPPTSIYLKAGGSDTDDGHTAETAFATFSQALAAAKSSPLAEPVIQIIGTLTSANAGTATEDNSAFVISDTGGKTIVIKGVYPATARLEGDSDHRVIHVTGTAWVRFENITIAKGIANGGGGILIEDDAEVTLGTGAVVGGSAEDTNYANYGYAGGGVAVFSDGNARFTMEEGSRVSHNRAYAFGGGVCLSGSNVIFTMQGGEIADNKASYNGGGVFLSGGSTMSMEGGMILKNQCTASSFPGVGGGGVYLDSTGSFMKTGPGIIYGSGDGDPNSNVIPDIFNPFTGDPIDKEVGYAVRWENNYRDTTVGPGERLSTDSSEGWSSK